jgi:hypothetical protein
MRKLSIFCAILAERGFLRTCALMLLKLAKLLRYRYHTKTSLSENDLLVQMVYVVAEKDLETLPHSIKSLSHIKGVRIEEIVLIGKKGEAVEHYARENGLRFEDEVKVLGFGPERYLYPDTGVRSGWLYQQMLKLGWAYHCNQEAYIVVDSDTMFLNDIHFMLNGQYVFFLSEEWNPPYSQSYEMLFQKKDKALFSYVAHMMIFDVKAVQEMLAALIKCFHVPWHEAIAKTRVLDSQACFSEYHAYGTWFCSTYPKRRFLCPLFNVAVSRRIFGPEVATRMARPQKTLSLHSYIK